jgi:hypothetical protein
MHVQELSRCVLPSAMVSGALVLIMSQLTTQ